MHSSLFPADCIGTRTVLIKALPVPLSYLLISFRPNYIVFATLTLFFAAEVLTRWAARQALSFLCKFSMCLLCKECDLYHSGKKVLIHILNVPTDELTTSGVNSVVEKGVKLLGLPVP